MPGFGDEHDSSIADKSDQKAGRLQKSAATATQIVTRRKNGQSRCDAQQVEFTRNESQLL
jgi:hypothetical protein